MEAGRQAGREPEAVASGLCALPIASVAFNPCFLECQGNPGLADNQPKSHEPEPERSESLVGEGKRRPSGCQGQSISYPSKGR